jgi:glycosyltransferase involved in cell wall biosynthesis
MRKNAELWATSQPHHKRIVGEIDGVICSTDELASRYETYAKRVFVCPNTVDPKDWPGLHPARMDETLRIGWAAGAQHGPDATLVEPALRWASKQPNVEVVVIGVQPGWDFEYTQVAFTPSLQTYRDTLSTFDISLAPVLGGDLNECKSDLKFLEATMAGAACIASDEPAYKTIIDGTTGILARTPADFTRAVKHLVGDPSDRFSLAQNAAKYVIRERTTAGARDGYLHVLEQTGAIERVAEAVAA